MVVTGLIKKKNLSLNLWIPFPGRDFLFLFTEEPCLIWETPAVLLPDVPFFSDTPPPFKIRPRLCVTPKTTK